MFKIIKESKKLNEDKENLIKALRILFDNSTLDNVKKVSQAKQIANALNIDASQLVD